MLILDTDAVTAWTHSFDSLHDRIRLQLSLPDASRFATTVVTLNEQMRGRLARIQKARTGPEVVRTFAALLTTFAGLARLEIIPFDQTAQLQFDALRPQLRRLGTMDLRIACIALANHATLLSRNLRDFRQVPGLTVEDWSR